jgi:spore coat protein CotH
LGFGNAPYRPYYEDGSLIPQIDIPGLDELIPGGAIGEENVLVKRFLATPKFRALYDRTYRMLFERLLESGRAADLVDQMAKVIRPVTEDHGLVKPEQFTTDLERDQTFLTDRIDYLLTLPPVGG